MIRLTIDFEMCERKPTREEMMQLWAALKMPWLDTVKKTIPLSGKARLGLTHIDNEPYKSP